MRKTLIFIIRTYQYVLSPYLPASCRYYPSCSQYTVEALNRHGLLKGMVLGVSRLCRCQPFSQGGHDPIPESKQDG